jgi:hypothetical protein
MKTGEQKCHKDIYANTYAPPRVRAREAGTNDPIFVLRLRPETGSDVPPMLRLRRLLKMALRQCSLRCLGVEKVEVDASSDASGGADEPIPVQNCETEVGSESTSDRNSTPLPARSPVNASEVRARPARNSPERATT